MDEPHEIQHATPEEANEQFHKEIDDAWEAWLDSGSDEDDELQSPA